MLFIKIFILSGMLLVQHGSGGTITNPSGDITGKIDLTNIENSLNNIDNGIQELPNKFYNDDPSGDKGIIQKVYEDLFTLDSGDVADIYNNLSDKFTSGDTPLITFTAFLDVLRSTSR